MDKTRYFLPLPPSFIEAYLRKTHANTPFFLLIYVQCWCFKLLTKCVLKKIVRWNKNFVQLYHNTLNRKYFFKPKVENQTHKIICFWIRWSCWLQNNILFSNRSKIKIFCKSKKILQILVRHFENLIIAIFSKT